MLGICGNPGKQPLLPMVSLRMRWGSYDYLTCDCWILTKDGQGKGNVDQEKRIREYGKAIGWKITRVVVENDLVSKDGKVRGVSAFKRRKVRLPDGRHEWRTFRPGLRLSLDLLGRGEHDGFIPLDADRAFRDPRDLEDLIDIVEEHNVPVESVTGSLRLANDADITMARVMVAMATRSHGTSRAASRRLANAKHRPASTAAGDVRSVLTRTA
jgi:site-specific DNA recombinase